jgi:hypothetical protein
MGAFETEIENVGPGWKSLVTKVHYDLTELLGDYELVQIKEKFGGLRYYFDTYSASTEVHNEAHRIVDEAERVSFTMCEECGDPGQARDMHGWIKTLCTMHYEQRY